MPKFDTLMLACGAYHVPTGDSDSPKGVPPAHRTDVATHLTIRNEEDRISISDMKRGGSSRSGQASRELAPVLDRIVEQSDGQRDVIGTLHQDVVRLQEVAVKGHQATTGVASGLEAVALTLTNAVDQSGKQQSADFVTTEELIGFTCKAVLGGQVPLPVHLEDNHMLERFLLTQPSDFKSIDRALVDWRSAAAAAAASTEDLVALLRKQQTPSPTDTPQTRIMRYRLAAITRAQIEGRGAVPPARPATTRAADRSAAACRERSRELAELWRAGESAAL